ncbi:MAG: DUF642 domain-containing protein [Prevotella sp.]
MAKLKTCLIALGLLGGGSFAVAQTDVTATYIQNPSFEESYVRFLDINNDRGVEKPNGWSVEWYQESTTDKNGMTFVASSMTQDGATWNAPLGNAYFARMRWANSTLYLRQTMCDMLPGHYTLKFKAIAFTSGAGTLTVTVAGQTQNVTVETTATSSWNDYSIEFDMAEGQKYATIEAKGDRTNDNFKFGIDEFTLTFDGSSYYPSLIAKAQALYDDNKDWTIGADVLQQAITDNSGKSEIADINNAIEALEAAIVTFKDANTVDVTARITNPTFDSNISGWTCTGGDGNPFQRQTSTQTNFSGGFLEKWRNGWNGGYNQKNFDVSQTITNLPKGEYTIKAAILAQMQGAKETLSNDYKNKKHGGPYYIDDEHGVWLYGTSGSTTAASWANSENTNLVAGAGGVYRTATIDVQDGTLTIGFKGVGSTNGGTELGTYANWVACDNWSLSYFGFDPTTLLSDLAALKSEAEALLANAEYENVTGGERTALEAAKGVTPEEKKTALETAISNLQAAINTFKAAKTSYDNFVEEKATADKFSISIETPTSAADAVAKMQQLNVDEYTKVTGEYTTSIELGSWTTSGAANFDNEHWSGTKRNYLNQDDSGGKGWNSNSWTMTCEQTITLPAGEYVFKAAGRKSTNAHLNLIVKNGETTIGTVSNFPNGNVGLGITTDGEASFDAGKTYANSNKGFGWQWRFVPFTLETETSITFTIDAGSDILHNWTSFGDYTVMAKPSLVASKSAYSQVCANADLAISAFPVAACAEIEAVNTAKTVSEETIEAYDNATLAVTAAVEALAAVKAKYQTLVDAKNAAQEELPYASASKYAALTAAKAVETTSETTATDAETYTANITSALRAYYESNGKAEGVEGAVDYTSLMPVTVAGDAMPSISYAELRVNNGQGATDSEGNTTTYYYDTNGTFYGSTNLTAHLTQTVTGLPTGKYLLTVQARGSSNLKSLTLTAGSESMNLNVQANTGVYGNMWDDYSLVTTVDKSGELLVKISGVTNSKSSWFGFNNFRLVKIANLDAVTLDESEDNTITAGLADVTLKRSIVANVWNTLVLPFNMTNDEVLSVFGEGAQVAAFSNTDGENVNFDTTTEGITANVPVLLKAAAGTEYAFNGYTLVEGNPIAEGTMYDFVGNYKAKYDLVDGEYMLYGSKFWKNDNMGYNVKGFRAYLRPKSAESAKSLNLVIDGQTTGLKLNTVTGEVEGESYNLAGQRVVDSYKGLVIKNGKKVIKR